MPQSHYLAKILAFESTLDYPQMGLNLDLVLQFSGNEQNAPKKGYKHLSKDKACSCEDNMAALDHAPLLQGLGGRSAGDP